jgi:hypothetical protein
VYSVSGVVVELVGPYAVLGILVSIEERDSHRSLRSAIDWRAR